MLLSILVSGSYDGMAFACNRTTKGIKELKALTSSDVGSTENNNVKNVSPSSFTPNFDSLLNSEVICVI
jgi:nitrogenase subunit NifH